MLHKITKYDINANVKHVISWRHMHAANNFPFASITNNATGQAPADKCLWEGALLEIMLGQKEVFNVLLNHSKMTS